MDHDSSYHAATARESVSRSFPPTDERSTVIESPDRAGTTDMREYLLVLRRRGWWVAFFLVLGVLLSYAYVLMQTPVYTSVSDVLVNASQYGNKVGPLATQVSMATEVAQVTSETIGRAAAEQLPWWHAPVSQLVEHVTATNPSNTLVVSIEFASIDPVHAKQGADAFANAYVEQRTLQVKPAATSAAEGLQTKIDTKNLQISAAQDTLAKDTPGTKQYLNDQQLLNNLKAGLAQLQTSLTNINLPVGAVTSHGTVPTSPSSPKKLKMVAEGLALGLLLGVIAAFIRDRMSDLPKDRDEIELILGAPVLAAEQPQSSFRRWVQQVRGEPAEGSWTGHRLLGLVLERWIGAHSAGRPAFMMASPVAGPDTSLVAAEASRTLAWTGRRVTCISSAIGDDSLSREFELPNDVGFSGIVAGDVSVAESATRIGLLDLIVVPSGPATDRSSEVLTTRGLPVLGWVVDQLKANSDVVVVAGPPLLGPNEGVAIAAVVDVVVVVISGNTTRGELHETRSRLGEMGVEIIGAVVTEQMSRRRMYEISHAHRTSVDEAADLDPEPTAVGIRVPSNGKPHAQRSLQDVPLESDRPAR